jgi:hypothetical protein
MSIRLPATFVSYRNERCYSPAVPMVLKALILGIFILGLESCHLPSYAKDVHPHGELALVGYFTKGAYSPLRAFFMRKISMRSHFMVRLERDTFECAGFLLCLSTNPFQLCHPHLVVNGKAPELQKERINRA